MRNLSASLADGQTDETLLIDYFYLSNRKSSPVPKLPIQSSNDDSAARVAEMKQIQKERGCSFMEARRIWLAQ